MSRLIHAGALPPMKRSRNVDNGSASCACWAFLCGLQSIVSIDCCLGQH